MIKAVIFDCFGVLTTNDTGQSNDTLFSFIRDALKPNYRIGLLSNAGSNMLDELFEPWQVELFDAVVLSYETGTVKPDPVIYSMIAGKLGVAEDECVFVDDIERFCTAAEAVGMKSIDHQDTADTIAKLKELTNA